MLQSTRLQNMRPANTAHVLLCKAHVLFTRHTSCSQGTRLATRQPPVACFWGLLKEPHVLLRDTRLAARKHTSCCEAPGRKAPSCPLGTRPVPDAPVLLRGTVLFANHTSCSQGTRLAVRPKSCRDAHVLLRHTSCCGAHVLPRGTRAARHTSCRKAHVLFTKHMSCYEAHVLPRGTRLAARHTSCCEAHVLLLRHTSCCEAPVLPQATVLPTGTRPVPEAPSCCEAPSCSQGTRPVHTAHVLL